VIFLHEPFTWLSAICSFAIILGVWGAQRFASAPLAGLGKKKKAA